MTIGQRIKRERIRHKLSQEDVARQIDSTKQAIYKYENEIVTNIPFDKVKKMAQLFGVSPSYLLGWQEDSSLPQGLRPLTVKKLPMLGNVACGEPIYAEESYGVTVSADGELDADFCLRAKGDSMINARIFDGDILFVKRQDIVEDGEIAVVLVEDEATVKRVYYDRELGVLTLLPENPTYKPMRYTGEELNRVRILGKVVSGQYRV